MEGSALLLPRLQRWMPGLHLLKTYESSNFRGDLVAGVSVAAVAIPIGIALAAILMVSAIGLFDIKSVVSFYKTSKPEFRFSCSNSGRDDGWHLAWNSCGGWFGADEAIDACVEAARC
jgi:hypothetical protein